MKRRVPSILALVPMALGLGQGSEANIPLGRAVVGGQLVSMVLTLILVPVLCSICSDQNKEMVDSNSDDSQEAEAA